MAVERVAGITSLIDVLDRVLDKGIVIYSWVRVSLVGIDLVSVVGTYLITDSGRGVVAELTDSEAEATDGEDVKKDDESLPGLKSLKKRRGKGGTGSGGAAAVAGHAALMPRAIPGLHRRPID